MREGELRICGSGGQRKPLKTLDSDKEIKANPKAFLWPTAPRPRRSALSYRFGKAGRGASPAREAFSVSA